MASRSAASPASAAELRRIDATVAPTTMEFPVAIASPARAGAVPKPGLFGLFAIGSLSLGVVSRRRRRV